MWHLFRMSDAFDPNAVVKFPEQEKCPSECMIYNNAHEDEWSFGFINLMNRLLPFIKFIIYEGRGVLEGVTFYKTPSCCLFVLSYDWYDRFLTGSPPLSLSLSPPFRCVRFSALNGHLQVRCSSLLAILCFRAGVRTEDSDRLFYILSVFVQNPVSESMNTIVSPCYV